MPLGLTDATAEFSMQHRTTIQRTLLLDTIQHLDGHATAEQIYALLVKRFPQISKATVYRNLTVLENEHQIMRIAVPDGADYYEHNTKPHYHIKCINCQQITDVALKHDTALEHELAETHGFAVLGHSLLFYGLCPKCQEEAARATLGSTAQKPPSATHSDASTLRAHAKPKSSK